jgi:ABC-2 type transport system ATP-binding protein
MSDIITVENLVEVYSDGTKAVDDISFSVKEGEFFGFLGPNGAGKSTTIKILTTLLKKTSGTAIIAGHDLDKDQKEIRKLIGVQSQETAVDGDLTGRENLTLQCHFQQMPNAEVKERVNELLKLMELEASANRRARNYSGGMKKRLDLAAALVHKPRLLFLDEPTTGLDPQSRAAIWDYLQKLNNEEGTTIFLTTQYMEEADKLCQRLSIIDFGKIVVSGTPTRLKQQVRADSIKLWLKNCARDKAAALEILNKIEGVTKIINSEKTHSNHTDLSSTCLNVYAKNAGKIIADIVRKFDKKNIQIASISISPPTLDDIFLQHTGRRIRAEELVRAPAFMFGGRRR